MNISGCAAGDELPDMAVTTVKASDSRVYKRDDPAPEHCAVGERESNVGCRG